MATIQLQGVGKHYAIPAKDLKPGHIVCWNFGFSSIVKAVEPSKTGKTITVTLVPRSNDELRQGVTASKRRFGAERLVAVEKDLYAEEYAEFRPAQPGIHLRPRRQDRRQYRDDLHQQEKPRIPATQHKRARQ